MISAKRQNYNMTLIHSTFVTPLTHLPCTSKRYDKEVERHTDIKKKFGFTIFFKLTTKEYLFYDRSIPSLLGVYFWCPDVECLQYTLFFYVSLFLSTSYYEFCMFDLLYNETLC